MKDVDIPVNQSNSKQVQVADAKGSEMCERV